jgi:hypothetical protein
MADSCQNPTSHQHPSGVLLSGNTRLPFSFLLEEIQRRGRLIKVATDGGLLDMGQRHVEQIRPQEVYRPPNPVRGCHHNKFRPIRFISH